MLGGLRAERPDQVVSHFETRKTGALLAYLAYFPDRPHPREVLMELLWQEEEPEATRARLRQTLASLRRAIEPSGMPHGSILVADRAEARFVPGSISTDAREFDEGLRQAMAAPGEGRIPLLREALRLYQGELLPGYYEEWIDPERQRLADLYVRGGLELARALAEAGDVESAVEHARRATAADPLREDSHCHLIRLLAVAGRRADALRQFRELERILREELRAAPSESTRALAAEISAGEGRMQIENCRLKIADLSGPPPAMPERPPAGTEDAPVTGQSAKLDLQSSIFNFPSPGGAVPPGSPFYVERPTDAEYRAALSRGESIVLVKGARQVGKTSLLARGLHDAREGGARIVLTDFQMLTPEQLASPNALFLALAQTLADQLRLDAEPEALWSPRRSWIVNFHRYLLQEALEGVETHVIWGMDEVDCLFAFPYASEVFGFIRSWLNARSLDPGSPWGRLTVAIAYATEAFLFISDLNQSPFNVGARLELGDFTLEQVAELNRRHGSPLSDQAAVDRLYRLVGGHPYLVRTGLHEVAARGVDPERLERAAAREDGPFGAHLRRLTHSLSKDEELCEAVRRVLAGKPCPTRAAFYRLRSAGVLTGDAPEEARPRCELYRLYLERQLR
jgi:DNA-binding SARP family transcriptional activator